MRLVLGYCTLNSVILHFRSFFVNDKQKAFAHQYIFP